VANYALAVRLMQGRTSCADGEDRAGDGFESRPPDVHRLEVDAWLAGGDGGHVRAEVLFTSNRCVFANSWRPSSGEEKVWCALRDSNSRPSGS
jgi:hypothetical protein